MKIERYEDMEAVDLGSLTIIDRLLLVMSMFVIVAPPKQGKSLVILNLIACLLTGRPFANHEVKQKMGLVIYVSGEGNMTLKLRLTELRKQFDDNLDGLRVIRVSNEFNIFEYNCFIQLINDINEQCDTMPDLIVFDTVRSMSHGVTETNDNWARMVDGLKLLRDTFSCVVGIVHHTTKDGKGYSGGNNLHGSVEALWQLSNGKFQATAGKDLPESEPIKYSIVGWGESAVIHWHSTDDKDPNDDNTEIIDETEQRIVDLLIAHDGKLAEIRIARIVFNPNATSVSPKQKDVIFKAKQRYTQLTLEAEQGELEDEL